MARWLVDPGGSAVRPDSAAIDAWAWMGPHFRFADTAAARMGQQAARYALDHWSPPVDEGHRQRGWPVPH